MNRRTMLGQSGLAVAGFAIGTAFTAPGCNPKNLSIYVQTIIGALKEISPLLPGAGPLIAKALKVAEDFDAAYRAGKFDNALVLFENLAGLISQLADSVGVSSPTVKVAIAVAGIALRAIAVLLKSQSGEPEVAGRLGEMQRDPETARRLALIEKLANPAAVDKVFAEAKP